MSISIEKLPDVTFAEKDISKIQNEIISDFENVSGRTLYPGDPLRILLLTFSKYFALLRSNIDLSAKQNLLKYAEDGYIENIASLVGVKRLEPTFATVTLTFVLSKIQESTVIIPKGTRVTCDDDVYFETTEDTFIPIGETAINVLAQCTEIGTIGNDYLPGQINKIVDSIGYVAEVSNVTTSSGGSDKESLENFRERILIAPESFSVAGPAGAYKYLAKTAHQSIYDVSVNSPIDEPGVVEIIPLLANGEIPTQDILDEVYNVCSADDKRPLTDYVKVSAPQKIEYDINITYYIENSDMASAKTIQNNVSSVIDEFVLWQKNKLGRDINPSKLISKIISAGVKRVDVTSPVFTKIEYNQIAVVNNINIIYGGNEDE